MTTNAPIIAAPLHLTPLSTQIQKLGGRGYNCDVRVTHIPNSFSHLYEFETPEGIKTLKTLNNFQVGIIDDAKTHLVIFNADTGEYTLVTPKTIKRKPGKLLTIKTLGFNFEEMKHNLQLLWPNRVIWKLTDPKEALDKMAHKFVEN